MLRLKKRLSKMILKLIQSRIKVMALEVISSKKVKLMILNLKKKRASKRESKVQRRKSKMKSMWFLRLKTPREIQSRIRLRA